MLTFYYFAQTNDRWKILTSYRHRYLKWGVLPDECYDSALLPLLVHYYSLDDRMPVDENSGSSIFEWVVVTLIE